MSVEGRDWIGNPDVTLVYWQAVAEDARRRLDRIAALCNDTEENGDPVVWLNVDVLLEILHHEVSS